MIMRMLLVLAFVSCFAGSALAQTGAPKTGKPPKQFKPSAPMGCKIVGTVRGIKLWAGDFAAPSEPRGTGPADEPEPMQLALQSRREFIRVVALRPAGSARIVCP
jgi:hypothetical protein